MKKETFDESRMLAHQQRAINTDVKGANFLVERVAEDFALRIASANREFSQCADLFSFSNCVYQALERLENVSAVTRYEHAQIAGKIGNRLKNIVLPMCDNQAKTLMQGVDLLVSAFGLHWNNDLSGLLSNARLAMKKDGLLLVALPAKGTLFELQDCLTRAELELCGGAGNRVDQFIELQQAGTLLQSSGFKLPVIDQEKVTVRYDDMYGLIRDLRAMGATSAIKRIGNRRTHPYLFKLANEIYTDNYSDADGRVRASFCIAYLTAWSPHENQQKPLKPGSAKISMASILKSNQKPI